MELDPLTGEIAKQLYQRASIAVEGFEKTNLLMTTSMWSSAMFPLGKSG